MSQLCALRQHSFKIHGHSIADSICAKIEVSQRCSWPKHSCKTLRPCIADVIADAAPGCHRHELSQNELALCLFRAIAGVAPEAPAQADNGRQAHLVHYLFDSLRRPPQHGALLGYQG